MNAQFQPRFAFGPFRLDPEGQRLERDGKPVPLKPKVFDLLVLLVENPGELLSKEFLMERLWPRQVVEESNITQSVYELRKALGERRRRGVIETVPKRGYRFTGEVTSIEPEQPAAARERVRTIAVLPFTPLPGADPDESLEQGLADTLIAALSRIPQLTVRPAGSSRRFHGPSRDSVAAGRALKVEAVLDGTIQGAGGRLRVTPRLIRIPSGSVLWADKLDQPASDIFEMQDAICERVVRALELELPARAGGALMPRHTSDPEVHALFLKCRHFWHKWTPDSWMRSIEYGRKALALDPAHAPSWSWIAASYVALGITGAMRPLDAFGHAAECVTEALKLDETLSEAHEVKGAIALFHDWDWTAAGKALDRAVELNPSNAGARDLRALLRIVTGRPKEALREVEKALEVDPLSLLINTDVGFVNYYAGDFETAIAQLERTLELDPWFAHARLALGYAYLQTGHVQAALAEFGAALEYSGRDPGTSPDLGHALAVSGRTGEARAIFDALLERSKEVFTDPYSLALVAVSLGDADAAFEWLERALEERSRELIYLRVNPVFRALEKEPRFSKIAVRVGI